MYGYGLYLLGGGRPDLFDELSDADLQVMMSTHEGIEVRRTRAILKGIATMFGGGEGE